jgi:peptide deformylase
MIKPEVNNMAIRDIRIEGDEVLRKTCRPVQDVTDRIRMILDDMAETMYEADGGGLAACQVGILRRLVVIDVGEGLIKMVNPQIILEEGEQLVEEGCLSFPGVWGMVKRPAHVVVRALNENGEEITVDGTGLLAQCLSHELDHLDGVVFKDKIVAPLKAEEQEPDETADEE